jgi:hypothetical protein
MIRTTTTGRCSPAPGRKRKRPYQHKGSRRIENGSLSCASWYRKRAREAIVVFLRHVCSNSLQKAPKIDANPAAYQGAETGML